MRSIFVRWRSEANPLPTVPRSLHPRISRNSPSPCPLPKGPKGEGEKQTPSLPSGVKEGALLLVCGGGDLDGVGGGWASYWDYTEGGEVHVDLEVVGAFFFAADGDLVNAGGDLGDFDLVDELGDAAGGSEADDFDAGLDEA